MVQLVGIGRLMGPPKGGAGGIPTAGLIRAWNPNSVSGNDVTSIPGAYGTTATLSIAGTSGGADVTTGLSPGGNNMLRTTAGNNEVGSFTSTGALSTWTIAVIVAGVDFSIDLPFLSKSTSTTQSYIRFPKNAANQYFRVEIRPDSGTATVLNFDTAQLMGLGGCYLVVMTWDSVNGLVIRVNGISKALAKTGTFTFDRIFQYQNGGAPAYSSAYWGRVAIWNRILSASEIAQVESSIGFGNDISTGLYVSQSTGDDTTKFGFSSGTPLKTIAAAITGTAKTGIITTGLSLGNFYLNLADTDTWTSETLNPPVSGSATKRFIIQPYSAGGNGRARLYGCGSTVGGWTPGGGALYTRTLAYKPSFVQLRTLSSTEGLLYEKLYDKTLGTPPGSTYFDYDVGTTTLTISAPAYFDPATTEGRIAANDANGCMASFSTNSIDIYNLDMWFWNSIIFHPSTTTGTVNTYYIDASYGFNDSIDASSNAAATINHYYPKAYQPGGIPNISGTGDCYSCHGASVVNYYYPIGAYGQAGIRSDAHVSEVCIGGTFFGNTQDLIRLDQGSGTGGIFTVINTLVTTTSASSGNAYEIQVPTLGTAATTTLQFLTIVNNGAGSSANAVVIGAGTATVTDTIMDGFHGGVIGNGSSVVSEDYNDFHNVPFATQGTTTSGGHSITGDPKFANAAAMNYLLLAGSPCFGAGVAIGGVTTDITGATRANPPTIGAYEA